MLRLFQLKTLLSIFRSPPPPPPALLPLLDGFENVTLDETPEEDEKSCEHILFAVPKRRVSHRRKRIKSFQKNLKPIQNFKTCPNCGEHMLLHYQLCPFCLPFNNYIKTKDVPGKRVERLEREYEIKRQAELLEKRNSDNKKLN